LSTTSERSHGKSIDNRNLASSETFEKSRRTSADNDPIVIIDKPAPISRKTSTESYPMSIDDKHSDYEDDNSERFHLKIDEDIISSLNPLPKSQPSTISKDDHQSSTTSKVDEPYLTSKEFNYTMKIMDEKINALYKLCRYIGEQQEQNMKSLKKLIAFDELSDQFWSVGYLIVDISILILIVIKRFSI
jgi:hypothetical protein